MAKGIKNADAVICKFRLASTKTTNHRLEVAQKKQRIKEKMVKRQKTEAIIAKCRRNIRRMSLSSREEENHENDTGNNTNPDKVIDKYSL